MKRGEIISTLNELIEICNDNAEGFMACADNARLDSVKLRTWLLERSHECTSDADELSRLVRRLCGAPATGTTALGALQRGWLNVKTAITGKKDKAVLEACERGEEAAKLAYQKALARELPEVTRLVVERQYQGVLKNCNRIKKLRSDEDAMRDEAGSK
jgi:uncharacterized protein (TIGR02284 family)